MGNVRSSLKRFVFWDYPRAGWQYDVVVGLILVFVFATPREWFRDQPRPSSVVMLPANTAGQSVYWLEPATLAATPAEARFERATEVLRARSKKHLNLVRLDPIFDSEQDIKGYMAYTTP